MASPLSSSLDQALDLIAPYGPTLKNGNSNHAPMVVEALCALGHPEAVMPWLARYRERMELRPPPSAPIGRQEWPAMLGRRERFSDWALFFQRELDEEPWPVVLDRWVERLASGFCAAATHGVIRVGHAVRALGAAETASRRRELADALASWASTWQRLPATERSDPGTAAPREAIRRVPVVPPERRRTGNIVASLAVLDELAEFAPVVDWVGADGPVATLIADLTELFARVCLANVHNIPTAIAFIHAVTSPAALGNILPQLREETARRAYRYAWQSCCALYACYGGAVPFVDPVEPIGRTAQDLARRAIAHGDEHVIKFTEACLTRHAIAPSLAYLAAADRIVALIPSRRPT